MQTEHRHDEPGGSEDLPSYLESRVPAQGTVLGVGWGQVPIRERLSRPGREIRWVADLAASGAGDAGAFDAVVWNAGRITREEVERARRSLAAGGTLYAAVPGTGPGPPRRRGGLPVKEEELLRHVVRRLSEGALAIRGERQLPGAGAEDGWTVLQARPDPFVIRPYRDGDEAAILDLFPACFHLPRREDHWRWKYRDNPWGRLKISLAFSPEGELAAHYASYPVPFWRHGRTRLALQMGDTMTHPAHRGVGRRRTALLARTVRHFFTLHRDGTYDFYYGFPIVPHQRFCVWFIGGAEVEPVGYRARDLDPRSPPGRAAGGYRVERVTEVDETWDRFFARVAPRYRFLTRRDARWIDWRYLRCPDADFVVLAARRRGRLIGWSVFRRREDRLVWGDALFDPRHAGAAASILAAAVRRPELAGARRLEGWFPPRPAWWHERLAALGLAPEPEPNRLAMMALLGGGGDPAAELGDLYYTMGDGDLF